ncbi:MAG: S8 family serine peptidase [Vicinamibacterales bacterium]
MKSLGAICRQMVMGSLALIALGAVPAAAQSTDGAVQAAMAAGARARVIMQFDTTAERDAAFNRLLDRGAAVRTADTEAGPVLVVLGSAAVLESELAAATRVSLDAAVAVTADQMPARAARRATAAFRARKTESWRSRIGGADNGGVSVAVIDSGFQPHADLPLGRLRHFKDFVTGGSTPVDGCGHGTHVAGIVAGNGASSDGQYAGVAPNVELVVLRVLGDDCSGNTSDVIDALEWVARNHRAHNIKVVNLSLGHDVHESIFTDPLVQAVERLARKGIAVVTAAGNKGFLADAEGNPIDRDGNPIPEGGTPIRVAGGVGVPCNAPSSICVGSLNTIPGDSNFDRVAFSSSSGPTRYDLLAKPDLVAPGVQIVSLAAPGSMLYEQYAYEADGITPRLLVGDSYFTLSGTSMASPAVAAAAALILEANRSLSANALKMSLQYTARLLVVPGTNQTTSGVLTQGAGALNLGGAMSLARNIRPHARFGKPWLRRPLTNSNADASGATITWGQRIIYGDRFMNPRYASIHLIRWEDDLVWGYDALDENIVWGNDDDNIVWGNDDDNIVWGNEDDNIVWGNDDNIVWGNDENIVWGNNEDANIVWGNDEADNIVWGNEDDNIVWGNNDDNIVWGNDDENIVWGNDDDNIVWGNGVVRGQWASKLIDSFWDDNIVWGNVTRMNEENIVWGNDDENIVWGNCSEANDDDNIVWGNSDDENIVWGNCENIVWGNDDDNIVWGNSVLTGSGR